MAVTGMDRKIARLAARTNHRKLAAWAADCAERVLPYYDESHPEDPRPREAVEAARAWVRTGAFRMADIRQASLAAHAAARGCEEFTPARSAARAAGQAVATAHAPLHSIAAAIYAATAIRDAAEPAGAGAAALKERRWQYRRLLAVRRRPAERRRSLK